MSEIFKKITFNFGLIAMVILYTFCKSPFTEYEYLKHLKEGDVVFQMSKSNQAKYIEEATISPWGHCGIIIKENNKLYVLEASKTVRLTPLRKWINKGKQRKIDVRRFTDKEIHIDYSDYIGKPYDTEFKFNNGKWYCSELVYDIYKNQLGIKICNPKRVNEYNIGRLKNILKQRNINENQYVVTPSNIYCNGRRILIQSHLAVRNLGESRVTEEPQQYIHVHDLTIGSVHSLPIC